jgi:hypothetical protein
MPNTRHSTADITRKGFYPHGLVVAETDGVVLRNEARGPFNEALFEAFADVHQPLADVLAAAGPWLDLYVIHVDAMATRETLDAYTQYLVGLSESGRAPCATAFVLPTDVEGADIMRHLYPPCFATAGLRFAIFEELAPAEAWLRAQYPRGD